MTGTKIFAAIRVDWWYGERVLEGEEQLRAELAENYPVSIVRTRWGGLGGGLYQLFVEFLSQLTLQEVARVLLEGVAFDLIASGTKTFFIRPFLDAYQRLKSSQKEEKRVGIGRFRLVFQDAAITIENLPQTDLLAELGNILQAVAENLEPMTQGTKGQLCEIFIPVFEDTCDERVCKFRTPLSTDESLDHTRLAQTQIFRKEGNNAQKVRRSFAPGLAPRLGFQESGRRKRLQVLDLCGNVYRSAACHTARFATAAGGQAFATRDGGHRFRC